MLKNLSYRQSEKSKQSSYALPRRVLHQAATIFNLFSFMQDYD